MLAVECEVYWPTLTFDGILVLKRISQVHPKSAFLALHIYPCISTCNDSNYIHNPTAQSSRGTDDHHSCANKPHSPAGKSCMKRAVNLSYTVLELGAEIPARAKSCREPVRGFRSLERGRPWEWYKDVAQHELARLHKPSTACPRSANNAGLHPGPQTSPSLNSPRAGKMDRKGQTRLLWRALKSKSSWAGWFGFQQERISSPALLVRVWIMVSSCDLVLSFHQSCGFTNTQRN